MIAALFNPLLYVACIVTLQLMILHIAIRNHGWLPAFRQLRLQRFLLLAFIGWGAAVLLHK